MSVVGSAEGTGHERYLPVPQVETRIEYRDQEGGPVMGQDTRPQAEVMFFDLPDGVNPDSFHATLTVTVDAPQGGEYEVSLGSAGLSRLSVDGQPAVNNWEDWSIGELYFSFGSGERRAPVHLSAGRHTLSVEYTPHVMDIGITPFNAVRVGFRARPDGDRLARAVALAAQADWVVLCVGTTGEWETEGVDRAGLTLPGDQDALVEAVLDVNPNVVVVLQTGGPVEMPWLPRVPAAMQAWFAGQEVGHAVADVLTGLAEPGGRLPQTFPHSLADDPTHPLTPDVQYPGEDGRVEYREGLYTGYRHVDRSGVTPMFPFGFGLSFTTFTLGAARLHAPAFPQGAATVTVPVTNAGARPGSTVAQLYVQPRRAAWIAPERTARLREGAPEPRRDRGRRADRHPARPRILRRDRAGVGGRPRRVRPARRPEQRRPDHAGHADPATGVARGTARHRLTVTTRGHDAEATAPLPFTPRRPVRPVRGRGGPRCPAPSRSHTAPGTPRRPAVH